MIGESARVVVVGSANVDLSLPTDHLPLPGETVLGGVATYGRGGKGANQAVAAARLGARVAFVGCTGNDDGSERLRSGLVEDGVDLSALRTVEGVATGLAVVMVDRAGENSIVVSPGANNEVSIDDLEAARPMLAGAAVVLAQLEVPLEVVAALPEYTSGRLILNPAPAPAGAFDVSRFDVVVPNRGELAALAGRPDIATAGENASLGQELEVVLELSRMLDCPAVVTTMGPSGALVVINDPGLLTNGDSDVVALPANHVPVVDTTGAGDSFCGAMAVALSEGATLPNATRWAVRAASLAVTKAGAQESMPSRSAVGRWPSSFAR